MGLHLKWLGLGVCMHMVSGRWNGGLAGCCVWSACVVGVVVVLFWKVEYAWA